MEFSKRKESVIELFKNRHRDVPASRRKYAEIVIGSHVYSVIAHYPTQPTDNTTYEVYHRSHFYIRVITKLNEVIAPLLTYYTDGNYTLAINLLEGTFTVQFVFNKQNRESIVIRSISC